ncbi:unnamed protein product [Adineta ricciae]|uniref:Akirin n=1 Tax=Adineta ricciae TaxID=249248 RepID=A0A814TJ80_ADIRI|nr:unnamed protein product [Adineta ricciae]CAF1162455.1 unnamed protein product [Adineta ricciae]
MLAVASLKRSLEFDPVEQGVKRKRAELKLSPPSSPVSSSSTTFTNPSSPSKQQSIFTSSPSKNASLVLKKPCSLTALTSTSSSTTTDDIPMFTYAQTAQMCAHLLREQDRSLREQYEQLLSTKLTEQYDTFVRYTHDNVHKDQSKQHRLFHFGQPQDTNNNTTTVSFSYVS